MDYIQQAIFLNAVFFTKENSYDLIQISQMFQWS